MWEHKKVTVNAVYSLKANVLTFKKVKDISLTNPLN